MMNRYNKRSVVVVGVCIAKSMALFVGVILTQASGGTEQSKGKIDHCNENCS